jgi:hypothetical protein
MANGVFNNAKARIREFVIADNDAFGILLLKANESEGALVDHADLADLLAAAGNTEADFTNYARKTALVATPDVDNTNDRVDVDIPDQTWTSAGGASNNTLTKLIVYFQQSASDAGRIPLTHHDFSATTDGTDLTAQINAAGFFRSF